MHEDTTQKRIESHLERQLMLTYRKKINLRLRGVSIFQICCRKLLETKSYQLKQEAFRERRHLHVCNLWPWRVTLTLRQSLLWSFICTFFYNSLKVSVLCLIQKPRLKLIAATMQKRSVDMSIKSELSFSYRWHLHRDENKVTLVTL